MGYACTRSTGPYRTTVPGPRRPGLSHSSGPGGRGLPGSRIGGSRAGASRLGLRARAGHPPWGLFKTGASVTGMWSSRVDVPSGRGHIGHAGISRSHPVGIVVVVPARVISPGRAPTNIVSDLPPPWVEVDRPSVVIPCQPKAEPKTHVPVVRTPVIQTWVRVAPPSAVGRAETSVVAMPVIAVIPAVVIIVVVEIVVVPVVRAPI